MSDATVKAYIAHYNQQFDKCLKGTLVRRRNFGHCT